MANKILSFQFRWPVKQTGVQAIECAIPFGDGTPILNHEFIGDMKLSDGEIDKAEAVVLRSIAIIE